LVEKGIFRILKTDSQNLDYDVKSGTPHSFEPWYIEDEKADKDKGNKR
jgi:hypothetical protein